MAFSPASDASRIIIHYDAAAFKWHIHFPDKRETSEALFFVGTRVTFGDSVPASAITMPIVPDSATRYKGWVEVADVVVRRRGDELFVSRMGFSL